MVEQVLILRLHLRVECGGRLRRRQGRERQQGKEETARERGSHGGLVFVLERGIRNLRGV